jgi:ABC-type multidrug transport system permease subunit
MAVAASLRAFPREKVIVSNEIASKMYGTLPYFVGKAISELPLAAFFSSVFAVLVSNLTGLHTTKLKWRRFLGLNSLHSLASQSVGLLLGAISPNSDVALALLPPVIILNMIFDGKHISEESVPRLLRWIPKLGLVRWGYEGFCLNEFDGLTFDNPSGPQRGPVAKTGADALARFGLGGKTLSDVVRAQGAILSSCWFLSYLGLALTTQKFEVMKPPRVP